MSDGTGGSLPVWLLPTAVAVLYLTLFAAERLAPLRATTRALWPRVLVNLAISAVALAASVATVRPAVARAFAVAEADVGLLGFVHAPAALEWAAAVLVLDWSFYWWHRANHRVPLLWRFHNVHHVDPDLDVTTALRFHAVEVGASAAFRVVQIVVVGPPAWLYVAYETAFQAGTFFHHANVRLPLRLERALNLVLVTPRMHGVHHSNVHDEADSNYSTILSCWDRLHGSLRLDVRQAAIEVGVPSYSSPHDNKVGVLLVMPFRRQRAYWRRPDGSGRERRLEGRERGPAGRMLD